MPLPERRKATAAMQAELVMARAEAAASAL